MLVWFIVTVEDQAVRPPVRVLVRSRGDRRVLGQEGGVCLGKVVDFQVVGNLVGTSNTAGWAMERAGPETRMEVPDGAAAGVTCCDRIWELSTRDGG